MIKLETVKCVLRPLHLQAQHCTTYFKLNSLLHHWILQCFPGDATAPASRTDDAVLQVAGSCFGDAVTADPFVAAWLWLPARMYGGGMRSSADIAPVVLISYLCHTLHCMLSLPADDGTVETGFMPQLAALRGRGSFDAGFDNTRVAVFLEASTRTTQAFPRHSGLLASRTS